MSAHADGCVFNVSVVLDQPNTGVTDSHRAPGREYLLATLYVLALQILPWSHRRPRLRDLTRVTSNTKKKEKKLSTFSELTNNYFITCLMG